VSGIIINPYSFASAEAFSSTKSLEFDGIDDYIDCGTYDDFFSSRSPDTKMSFSFWFKTSPSGDAHPKYFFSCANYTNGLNGYIKSGIVYFGTSSSTIATSTSTYDDGNWHHCLGVWDNLGTTPTRLWIDGVLVGTDTSTRVNNFNEKPFYLGRETGGTWYKCYGGNLDEFAVWEGDMSGDVATIYNSGTPTDLTSLSPVAWYRMGENSTFKTPQILMPENINKDKVSNYSMEFDGVDDNIDCGDLSAYDNGDFTFSCWIYKTTSALEYVWSNGGSSATAGFGIAINNVEKIWMKRFTRTIDCATGYKNMGFTLNNWHNIVGIYTDSTNTMECYVDGILKYTKVGAASTNSASLDLIMGSTSPAGSYDFTGKMDEFSIFNSVKAIGDIWDGTGKPTDLTGESGLVGYWRMGEEATYDAVASEWTIPDQAGSNDGTSANMTIEDREGDAPDSENNALSYNMDAADIDPDTP